MSCNHKNIEYGQENEDWQKKLVKRRCVDCGWKTYTLYRSLNEVPVLNTKEASTKGGETGE